MDLIQRLHVGRALSVLTTLLVSIAVAGGIGWIIANQLVEVANQLPLYRENIQAKINALHHPVTGQVGKAAESMQEIARELTSPARIRPKSGPEHAPLQAPVAVQVVDAPTSGWTELRNLGTPVLAPLGRTGIVVIFSVFMLLKREDLRNRLLRLAGIGQLNLMTQALDDAAGRVSRYLLMQFLVNAGFGALFGLGLYCDWRALSGVVGRGGRHTSNCALRRNADRRDAPARALTWPFLTDGSSQCWSSCWRRVSN